MSRILVQCRGSGEPARGGQFASNPKSQCRWCGKSVPVAANGRQRKHVRTTTRSQLRRGR